MRFKDMEGKDVPSGKVHKRLTTDFMEGKLPYWLETFIGTGSFTSPTNRALYQATTDATASASAQLRTVHEFNTQEYTEISFTAEALQFSGNIGYSAQIAIKGVDCGVAFYQLINQTVGTLRVYKAGNTYTDFPTNMSLFHWNEGHNRKNLTISLLTGMQYPASIAQPSYVYLSNGDQTGFVQEIPLVHGLVRGLINTQISGTTPQNFRLAQAKLDLFHN